MKRYGKLAPLLLVAALASIWLLVGRNLPRDQSVHVILGSAAPRVTELRLGYSGPGADDVEPTREVTFHWAEGAAPRIVTHEPRLANGAYLVQIQIRTRMDSANVKRRVTIEGSPVSVDVQEAIP